MRLEQGDKTQPSHATLRGIHAILAELRDPNHFTNRPAFSVLQQFLTMGGRIPFEQAVESLTPFGQKVVAQIQVQLEAQLVTVESLSSIPHNSCLVIQEGNIGHVSILLPDELDSYPLKKNNFVIGAIQFSPDEYDSLMEDKRSNDQRFLNQAHDIALTFKSMEQTGELSGVIANVRDNLKRIGPTLIYVGHRPYSTLDQTDKSTEFLQQPINSWSLEDLVYAYGVHLLLMSGGTFRLEEFNSGQLTPDTLNSFFDNKAAFYSQHLGEKLPQEWFEQSLPEKAQGVYRQLQRVNLEFQRYRNINGLTIRQEEKILGLLNSPPNDTIQNDLIDRIGAIFRIDRIKGESNGEFWKRVTQYAIRQELKSLPLLFWSILQVATEATNSDAAISSTFRDLRQLATDGPLGLDVADYFCCVVPSQRMIDRYNNDQLSDILDAIAKRMAFNRWRFAPGNIPRQEVPLKRHWLYPPGIPDIATGCDAHHVGHQQVELRHSLRIPAPITVADKEYKGGVDIRLMRQSGFPFRPEDILIGREYIQPLRIILSTIAQYVEDSGQKIRVDAFTTEWYNSKEWIRFNSLLQIL